MNSIPLIQSNTPVSMHIDVAAGATEILGALPTHTSITIEPGDGGTMTVTAKMHPSGALVDIDPSVTTFSESSSYSITGPVYELHATASAVAGAISVIHP